jgi:hypothetical protein
MAASSQEQPEQAGRLFAEEFLDHAPLSAAPGPGCFQLEKKVWQATEPALDR